MVTSRPQGADKFLQHRVGYFVSRVSQLRPDGSRLHFSSRSYRKGLAPVRVDPCETVHLPKTGKSPWLSFWAPQRLAWWVSLLFIIGSACFVLGGHKSNWPQTVPKIFADLGSPGEVFFVGSLFFTGAAWLQFLEVVNADVTDIGNAATSGRSWRWFAWNPRNAGFSASLIQLVGTLLFNLNCADALLSGLSWSEEELLIWVPGFIGSICFLASSHIGLIEVGHRYFSFQIRKIGWWIVAFNMLGSIAFMASALFAFVVPKTGDLEWAWGANLFTLIGAVMFLLASYLMIPELFGAAPDVTVNDRKH